MLRIKEMRCHLPLDLLDEFGPVIRNGIVIKWNAVGKTVFTVADRGNGVLLDSLQDEEGDFSKLCFSLLVFQFRVWGRD